MTVLSPLAALLSRKRLLIFDLDGTLIDSSPLHARAFQETFAPYGVEIDYPAIAGLTTAAAIDRLAEAKGLSLSPERRNALAKAKRERALQLVHGEVAAFEGAVEFVQAAAGRFRLALATSASRAGAEAALSRVGLERSFEPIVAAEDVQSGKPDPEPFLKALNAHGMPTEAALVFEDSQSGIDAAAAAGIDFIRIAAEDPAAAWARLLVALRELTE
jgi:HAD superfamily hydrolase (TIGR01509 family)